MSNAAFDIAAAGYDENFTHSLIGTEQRNTARRYLSKFLEGKKNLQILEINCGTGEDALWLAGHGHHVMATDQSPAMIAEAKKKIAGAESNSPEFFICSFSELGEKFKEKKFDLVFSNFAGLNCVNEAEIIALNKTLLSVLHDDGDLAIVVFGKRSLWESFTYLLKASPRKAFRRWKKSPSFAAFDNFGDGQPVYYYSVGDWQEMLAPFCLVEKKPVGLFIPPSYLEAAMKKHPGLFRSLVRLDKQGAKISGLSSLADHVYLLFKKEVR
jgi:ubiquinone/menaquinone biosynthesis C-methylase UbiE